MNEIKKQAAEALAELREKKPLVHCITNYVTAGDTANMLLAAGASPIMADDPAEAAEISAQADALLINMGTLSERHAAAMIAAGRSANLKGIPVVLDPVGVQLSEFRRSAAARIFSEVKISVVRGNISELAFLAGMPENGSHGVDSELFDSGEPAAKTAAERLGCVCAATGGEDAAAGGTRAAVLSNGCAGLKKVTGAGCMTTALTAAFAAVCEPFLAAVFGMAFMGICGELAENSQKNNGMGSFRTGLFDAAGMSGREFAERIKFRDISLK